MIRVNLLQNSVERTSVEAVETAISSKGTRQILLVLIAAGAAIIAAAVDYVGTVRDNTRIKEELAVEQKTAAQLQELLKEVKEMQSKNEAVENRINAIQRLRADQIGPSRLLQAVDARLPLERDFRLTSIKQDKDSMLVINGYSPSEAKVTEFAQRLEFANGLFSKFHVETKRIVNPEKEKADKNADKSENEVIEFVIKCMYSPESLLANNPATPPNNGETKNAAATAPAAKNAVTPPAAPGAKTQAAAPAQPATPTQAPAQNNPAASGANKTPAKPSGGARPQDFPARK